MPDGSIDYTNLLDYGKKELEKVDAILGDTKSYIDFIPYIPYRELPEYCSRAKCGVLASLYEGKNRFINEAQSSNLPVIVFADFNKYVRGGTPVFMGNSGEYVPEFTPEALADTIHHVIMNPKDYAPRKNYLKYNGRKNFVKKMVNCIPYYLQNIPNIGDGDILKNRWVNEACLDNYGVPYEEFLYDKVFSWCNIAGLGSILATMEKYKDKFLHD